MLESALQSAIHDLLAYPQYADILWLHIRPARLGNRTLTPFDGHAGFPDLLAVGPGGLLFRELKQEGRYPKPEQRRWITALTGAGQDAGVWRPADLRSGDVKAALDRLRAA